MKKGDMGSLTLPTQFEKLAPIDAPQLEYDHGFISGWKHNWKMARIAKSEALQAQISDDRLRQVKNNKEMIKEAITFSKEIEAVMAEYNHRINHANHLDEMDKLERIKTQEVIKEQIGKNQLLTIEINEADLGFKIKFKDSGYADTDEDR